MIISRITSGIGNQLWQYAAGRCVAHRLNTEFKLDISRYQVSGKFVQFALDKFNITAKIATPQEVKAFIARGGEEAVVDQLKPSKYNIRNCPDNTYIRGYWESERYFSDITDIIREEFTLKNPLSAEAQAWKQKILSAECSVALHVRHGDFAYHPSYRERTIFALLPIDYYLQCINILRQQYNNLTVFVFSNNMPWVKDNLRVDVPIEFIEDCRDDDVDYKLSSPRDVEELYLMSLCKHTIMANSTFSFWGGFLNRNPDKKCFLPMPSSIIGVPKKVYRGFMSTRNEKSPIESDTYIRVAFDLDNQPEITIRPIFSLLLVVNDDASTIAETLDSLLGQDYKYYEVIIIDNASTDGSGKICRQAIAGKKNVKYKRLRKKVSNAVAWNRAFKTMRGGGYYVSFLKSGDRLLTNACTTLYYVNERRQCNYIHHFAWLEESENGPITVGEKKYSEQRDAFFKEEAKPLIISSNGLDGVKFLASQQINSFLGTKIYNCEFLKENGIKFDEKLADGEAELFFQLEVFFKCKYFMYVANALYIAPRKQ